MQENEEKILEKLNSIEERIQLIEDKLSQGISSRELYQAVKKEAIDYSTRDKHEED